MRNYKLEKLQNGECFTTSEKGNSMVPLIKSGQEHKLEPVQLEDVVVGDIVYCKVKGNFYTHLVKAIDPKKLLKKGYCILFSEKESSAIVSSHDLNKGQEVRILFSDGKAKAQILAVQGES